MPENLLEHAGAFRLYTLSTEGWANATPWSQLSKETQQIYISRADMIQASILQNSTLQGYKFHV